MGRVRGHRGSTRREQRAGRVRVRVRVWGRVRGRVRVRVGVRVRVRDRAESRSIGTLAQRVRRALAPRDAGHAAVGAHALPHLLRVRVSVSVRVRVRVRHIRFHIWLV